MIASIAWLKNYINIAISPKELASKLTMSGINVAGIKTIGAEWDNIEVGEVTEVTPHPNADRLNLATVNLNTSTMTVVCGAPNIRAGQKIAFAHVGASLIDGHTGKPATLKKAKIRGIVSEGMVCSEKELGISNNHEEILVLSSDFAIGTPLRDCLGDVIFDLEVTPNRPDCLCMIGLAREISALTDEVVSVPETNYMEMGEPIESCISVNIRDKDLCPRYCASLITGIKVKPSPYWMQRYLTNCGMRPINNIVDITNFVMLEYGQPLHSFNYDKISNNQIIVRKAKPGETITTLDGIYRPLSENMLVIADAEKPIAIAGIMGGFESEVEEDTTNILLESANFSRSAIRRGNKQLGLKSEASLRFDKGLSADLSLPALKRATQLLQELADGKVAKGIADEYPGKVTHEEVTISEEELKRITGMEIKSNQIIKTLTSLGFECRQDEHSLINVKSPYWRTDIRYSADLIEEVVRIIGYDSIPTTRLSSRLPKQELLPERLFRNKISELLVNTGFQEVLTYSLTSLQKIEFTYGDDNSKIYPLKVINPMTSEQEYLRTNLRSSMLSTIANNQKYESGGIKIFEIGKVFIPSSEISTKKCLPHEKEMLCIVLSGSREETGWQNSKQNINFYDAKGVVEKILSNWHLIATYIESNDNCLYPGRGTDIIIDGSKIGMLGEIHPKVAQYFEIAPEKSTFMIEIDIERLRSLAFVNEGRKFHEITKYPEITRDISIVVDNEIRFHSVEEIVRGFPLIKNLVLFDLYTGKQIPESKKSFALRLTYQSNDHTLTNEEVDKIENRVLKILNDKLGAVLRS